MIRHLYVHIPFCHRICPYCSFYKHQPGGTPLEIFLAALEREAQVAAERLGDKLALETIYFGGGTPTLLSTKLLEQFLPNFLSALGSPQIKEWTMEANPLTIDARKCEVMRGAGVTRASLGVQAWDELTLQTLGRDHAPAEAEAAYQLLREARFPVVSIDLMFSAPRQSLEQWRGSLEKTASLNPDHVSCYNLTYEEDTEFFERFTRGEYTRDEETDAAFFLAAIELLGRGGFEHYEISNYAKPGFQSVHNRGYWRGNDYLGLGPSAVSTVERRRMKNVSDTAGYIKMMQETGSALVESESLSEEQWLCERLALELRTMEGIDGAKLAGAEAAAATLQEEGHLEKAGENFHLTQKGKLVADSVIGYLWDALSS